MSRHEGCTEFSFLEAWKFFQSNVGIKGAISSLEALRWAITMAESDETPLVFVRGGVNWNEWECGRCFGTRGFGVIDQRISSRMKKLQNFERYITEDTLRQCFARGSYRLVDKVLCGNGFSTRFLLTSPIRHHVNILIAPNIQVVKGKEREYLSGRIQTPNKIGFFMKGA